MKPEEVKQIVLDYFKNNYSPGQYNLIKDLPYEPPIEEGLDWAAPPTDEKHSLRILFFAGNAFIPYLNRLGTFPKVRSNIKKIIVLENNPKIVASFIHDPRFLPFLHSKDFRFIFLAGTQYIKPLLFNILKHPEFSTIMEHVAYHPAIHCTDELKKTYEYTGNIILEVVHHVYHNYGRIDDSLEGVKATLLNSGDLQKLPGVIPLRNRYKGKTAAIIGAGPYLDKYLDQLKEHQNKLLIIAADAAVKPLLKAGITPDFTTSIERGNIYQKPFWEGLPPISTELVYYPVVHPEVLALYPGPKRPVYRNYSYFAYFEYSWPKGMLSSGGSTSHLANRLAHYCGVDRIIYIGIDNAYQKHETDDTYRSHCNHLGYNSWSEYKPIEKFREENKHAPAYLADAMDGSKVMTNITYHQWAKEFSEDVMVLDLVGRAFILEPKALGITGVTLATFDEALQGVEPFKPLTLENTQMFRIKRPWDHTMLKSICDGWVKMCLFSLKFLTSCKEKVEFDAQLASYIRQFFSHKFLQDHLFVSFIIQNCAAEYYHLENEWNALPLDITKELDKRLDICHRSAHLYLNVVTKLKTILDEVA